MSLKERLLKFMDDLDVELGKDLGDDTPLLTSGVFDSLALFRLAEWIEQEVGEPIEPTEFDLRKEWDTVSSIVGFIEKRRGGSDAPAG